MIETMVKCSMVGLLAASAPVESNEVSLWAQWGLAGIVVAYVLWRDHHRERRMAASIEAQQKWIRDTLLAALERNAKAMERMAWSFEQSIQADKPTRRMEAVDDHHG